MLEKNNSNKYIFITIILLVLMSFSLLPSSYVYAEGGDGSGGGTGQGQGLNKDTPLTLSGSSIENNSTDVPVNETIQLNFNKNICNITILPNNKKCFHLSYEDGTAVPIKLIFPDNQVQVKYKREVFITPVENLEPNTTYRISVDNTLQAKNGTIIDNAHTVTFTTGEKQTDKSNAILDELGDNIVVYEVSYDENNNSIPVNKDAIESDEEETVDVASTARIFVIVAVAVIILIVVVVLIIKRRKKVTS